MRCRTVNDAQQTRPRAFTLVELLTVIAIIVLLVGLLMPAVNSVRRSAKTTVTKGLLGTLSTGLETYRANQQVGGAYPPSAPDQRGSAGNLIYRVDSPYENTLANGPGPDFVISGAGLLVWALAGADLGGTPGFRTFRSGSTYWSFDCDDEDNGEGPGAYALDSTTREPLRPRVAPFVDLSKVNVTRWNANAGSFEIPTELEARDSMGTPPENMPVRNYPMFLDSFGGPILYCRADPAGVQAVDRSPNNTGPRMRGIYHFLDNGSLISDIGGGPSSGQPWVMLRPRSTPQPHNLRWVVIQMPGGGGPAPNTPLDGFWAYVRNKDIQARVSPHNAESYLLISAGADGIYGTGDDVTNFDHNGAELTEPE